MDRLTWLVFSFYREDLQMSKALIPIKSCKMSRGFGVINIECIDAEHLEEVSTLIDLLRLPLAALRLARQIVLNAPGHNEQMYPIQMTTQSDLLT